MCGQTNKHKIHRHGIQMLEKTQGNLSSLNQISLEVNKK